MDDELKKLIHIGKRHDEIAIDLITTKKSIQNRCFRLKLQTVYHGEIQCKQCGNFFLALINNKRVFCSKSCANTFSSTGRIHNEESKKKVSEKLLGKKRNQESIDKISGENNPMWIDGRSFVKNQNQNRVNGKRKCKYCNDYKIDKKYKAICDDCRESYYKFYRPSCEFIFDINLYKNEFDFSLIKKYGWYSPTNKGNNLNGVSKDHLYSIKDGFINKVSYEIMSHPANCKLLKHSDNSSKHCISSISLDELKSRIKIWNEKYEKG